jgi:hypothetical protein
VANPTERIAIIRSEELRTAGVGVDPVPVDPVDPVPDIIDPPLALPPDTVPDPPFVDRVCPEAVVPLDCGTNPA